MPGSSPNCRMLRWIQTAAMRKEQTLQDYPAFPEVILGHDTVAEWFVSISFVSVPLELIATAKGGLDSEARRKLSSVSSTVHQGKN